MARYFCSFRPSGAGSTTLPMAALCGIASRGGRLREVGITNTTAVAVAIGLKFITSAGTPGSGQTEGTYEPEGAPLQCAVFDVYTSTPPSLGAEIRRTMLAGVIGAGVIWTFGDTGVKIPAGTANGIAIIPTTGTGQICDVYFDWDE